MLYKMVSVQMFFLHFWSSIKYVNNFVEENLKLHFHTQEENSFLKENLLLPTHIPTEVCSLYILFYSCFH